MHFSFPSFSLHHIVPIVYAVIPGKQSPMALLCLFCACSTNLHQKNIKLVNIFGHACIRRCIREKKTGRYIRWSLGSLEEGRSANLADNIAGGLVL